MAFRSAKPLQVESFLSMAKRVIGIIMNGVTGRMGASQHLARSIVPIREQGGIDIGGGEKLYPEPFLIGRSHSKLEALAAEFGISRFSTSLDEALADPEYSIYFDAQTTAAREGSVRRAILAGKNIYCEKPVAASLEGALALVRLAREHNIKTGVVQDKLFLPGIRKLKSLVDNGFFGRILSVRGEFGYWVFEGDWQRAQRPSWNYKKELDGGIILDMFSHWRYLFDHTIARVRTVSCIGARQIPERVDEQGRSYQATADDMAFASFELEGGIIAQMNASWTTRVYRDDLLTLQVDGTLGSAVAGLRHCKTQHRVNTPRPVWNPDIESLHDYRRDWQDVPDNSTWDNAFRVEWEMFLRHVATDSPFPYDLADGARGVQLAEFALQSWHERRWVDVPDLKLD
jgi:predicted dehydrogenase